MLTELVFAIPYLVLALLLFIALVIVAVIALQYIRISSVPSNVSWVGVKDYTFFSKLQACYDTLSKGRSMIDEGYEKYGKHGNAFVLPGWQWNSVVLPPSNTAWIAHQPEHVLSGNAPLADTLGLQYLAHGPNVASTLDFTVIRRDLTQQLLNLNDQILDEIQAAFNEELGNDTEWKEVKMVKVIQNVTFRVANRMFVGLPLCQSPEFQAAVFHWSMAFGTTSLIMRFLVPKPLIKFVLAILAVPAQLLLWRAASFVTPTIRQRLVKPRAQAGNEKKGDRPNDMMQWIIDCNARKNDPAELYPSNIAGKMITFNIFATGTTSMMAGSALIKILAYPEANELVSELRDEYTCLLPEIRREPRQLRNLVKMDSVIRETLRLYPTAAQSMVREVVNPGGITTPDGLYLPQGTHISNVVTPMHRDAQLREENDDEFKPLRYYHDAVVAKQHNREVGAGSRQRSAVQINEEFLSFGLGKHACPGRFFAVHLIKLMLGHLLSHYDLEPFAEEPKFNEFAEILIPPEKIVVRIRSKESFVV